MKFVKHCSCERDGERFHNCQINIPSNNFHSLHNFFPNDSQLCSYTTKINSQLNLINSSNAVERNVKRERAIYNVSSWPHLAQKWPSVKKYCIDKLSCTWVHETHTHTTACKENLQIKRICKHNTSAKAFTGCCKFVLQSDFSHSLSSSTQLKKKVIGNQECQENKLKASWILLKQLLFLGIIPCKFQ